MIILGIDPGMATTGYGIIKLKIQNEKLKIIDRKELKSSELEAVDYGVISTPAGEEVGDRLKEIYNGVRELIAKYQPKVAAIESLFFCNNQKTAMLVGQARGVVLLACKEVEMQIYEYTPRQVKQAVVGYGMADKNQVQQMVKNIFDLVDIPKPDDAADALALCYCAVDCNKLRV